MIRVEYRAVTATVPFVPTWVNDDKDRLIARVVQTAPSFRMIESEFRALAEIWGIDINDVVNRADALFGPAPVPGEDGRSLIERALYALVGRAREDRSCAGGFRLDKRPARAVDVIDAANLVFTHKGLAPINYPVSEKGGR